MDSNINNEKSLKPLSLNDLRQRGGGVEQSLNTCHYEAFLRHPEADSRHSEALAEESTCNKNNKIGCHPEERSELRILPIMEDNKERWSDSEHTKSSQERKDECFRMTTSRHSERSGPCGHPDSYGSPSACLRLKQESTCLENNKIGRHPEFISGSVPFAQSANEQAQSENLSEIVQSDHPQDIQMLKSSSSTLSCKLHYIQQQEELQVQHDGYSLSNTLTKLAKTAAISLALSFFIAVPAMAQAPTPTLDNLHNQEITMPDTGEIYPESAYTLTEIENADPDNLPQNVITLYDKTEVIKYYDPITGAEVAEADRLEGVEYKEVTTIETTPKYYLVNLKDSVTNIGEGDTTKYFEWSQNADTGNLEFKEVSTPTDGKQTITVKYNNLSDLKERINNTEDKSLETITGTFVNQTTGSTSGNQYGGAIYNNGTNAKLGDINADFIGNYASSNTYVYGGAIFNVSGTIGDITGDFIGNYASGSFSADGGAIYNDGTIGNITGDFIGNYASSTNGPAFGGAIANNYNAEIGDITGDFIGNYALGNSVLGGAIYNDETIGDITGDFIGNYASSTSGDSMGGAIYNNGTIEDITGDFIGNYASSTSGDSMGGAIYNYSSAKIGGITGDFIGNYATSTNGAAEGGAIFNSFSSNIKNITGDFIGNYASGSAAEGGAIFNDNRAIIGNIAGNFIGNYVSSTNTAAHGGVIFNDEGTIGDITCDFIGNYATSTNNAGIGGAIYNFRGTIGDITGNFIGNYASGLSATGGAITNSSGTIGDITGEFIGNYASGEIVIGGAIYNGGTIGDITGDFIGNYASSTSGLAIGGAIANVLGYIGTPDEQNQTIIEGEIKNSSFINNYAESKTDNAAGGAIFSGSNINIVADNGQSIFSGNKTISNGKEEQNAIGMYGLYVSEELSQEVGLPAGFLDPLTGPTSNKNTANLKLEAKNNGIIVFDDTIRGGALDYESIQDGSLKLIETPETAFDLKVTGDSTGKVILNNDVINANISLDNTNLYLGREDVFDKSVSLSLNSGSIYLNNNAIGTMHVPTLNLNGNTNISVDADLANKSMDRITADNYNITNDAKLNVNNVVLLSDAKEDVTNILFADTELKGSVAYTGVSPIAYSPIYKYEVTYNPDDGFFTFSRGGGASSGSYDAYNPAVLAPSVTQQAGAYTTQLQTFNFAFQHADTFMNIPYMERLSIIEQGKYALSPTGDATDVGTYSPLMIKQHDPGFWVKPYASFENIPLKNGPKVSNINYGTLIGYDTPIKEISNGFERVLTGYIGYNGASQRYSGVDAYQNGGLLGGTATFYKGNFFNATTLSVGATAGDATTMYGSENYTMLLAGIGNKTGYNFEFFKGKMILQPNFLISYTFVNTFDYTNGAGVRIESDPLHAIQLSPGLKLIGNTKNGWQPYIGVNMVWNLLDDSKVTANDVRLPEMSIKPYVQYGVGIQKRFKDRFLAFGQAMIHNGGRNGVSLTAGLRWKVGKE